MIHGCDTLTWACTGRKLDLQESFQTKAETLLGSEYGHLSVNLSNVSASCLAVHRKRKD